MPASTGNVGNLPIVIVQGVCADGSSMFQAAFPGLQCAETGVAMVAFGMWVGGELQFPLSVSIINFLYVLSVHELSFLCIYL